MFIGVIHIFIGVENISLVIHPAMAIGRSIQFNFLGKEEKLHENSGRHITNLARPAANGGSIGYGCGAVGKVLSCTK